MGIPLFDTVSIRSDTILVSDLLGATVAYQWIQLIKSYLLGPAATTLAYRRFPTKKGV
jgi:hypothetical protein